MRYLVLPSGGSVSGSVCGLVVELIAIFLGDLPDYSPGPYQKSNLIVLSNDLNFIVSFTEEKIENYLFCLFPFGEIFEGEKTPSNISVSRYYHTIRYVTEGFNLTTFSKYLRVPLTEVSFTLEELRLNLRGGV